MAAPRVLRSHGSRGVTELEARHDRRVLRNVPHSVRVSWEREEPRLHGSTIGATCCPEAFRGRTAVCRRQRNPKLHCVAQQLGEHFIESRVVRHLYSA